jgi:CheY-like chemotaxis protein
MAATERLSHILVVEDNGADVFLIRKAIQDHGIAAEVTVCVRAEDALDLIDSTQAGLRPNAIILDLSLPGIGGLDLLERMRSRPEIASVPVMIFTSSPSPADKNRVDRLGDVRYVQKPSGLDKFLSAVADNVKAMLSGDRGMKAN